MKTINRLLKEKRIEKAFTQREVSRFLGYPSPQYLSNIERGVCSPSLEVIQKLSELYGLDKTEIIETLIRDYREQVERTLRPRLARGKRAAR